MRLAALTAVAALLALPAAAHAGPPWVAVELPANPLNAETREAYLLVRTYHHDRTISMRLTGRAEGIVNGERRTVPLTFREVDGAVYALDRSWPEQGTWVLVITAGAAGASDGATALVGVGPDGQVASVRVPHRRDGRWLIPTAPSDADIERSLRTLAGLDAPEGSTPHLGWLPLLLIPAGLGASLALRKTAGR